MVFSTTLWYDKNGSSPDFPRKNQPNAQQKGAQPQNRANAVHSTAAWIARKRTRGAHPVSSLRKRQRRNDEKQSHGSTSGLTVVPSTGKRAPGIQPHISLRVLRFDHRLNQKSVPETTSYGLRGNRSNGMGGWVGILSAGFNGTKHTPGTAYCM